jgi:hypothetical protein
MIVGRIFKASHRQVWGNELLNEPKAQTNTFPDKFPPFNAFPRI